MGLTAVRLMTNNPDKIGQLEQYGITITERLELITPAVHDNIRYLKTKKERLHHYLAL